MPIKPTAVLISDIHYNINTLPLANAAMNMAISAANKLNVPLIVAGDLHDTKAILRGECVKALIDTFTKCITPSYLIVGNHCRLNEKSPEHSLEFLRKYTTIIDIPTYIRAYSFYLLPYFSDLSALQTTLKTIPAGSLVVCHQGVQGALSGEYVLDHTAAPKEWFSGFRTVSGHYHRRQDIKCGSLKHRVLGTFSYIGNPYSLTFGEAEDGPKGFQILLSDGTLEFCPTGLRKHLVVSRTTGPGLLHPVAAYNPGDLVWLKVTGTKSELDKIHKKEVAEAVFGTPNIRFDKIPLESEPLQKEDHQLPDDQLFDTLIDKLAETKQKKDDLKRLWRELV